MRKVKIGSRVYYVDSRLNAWDCATVNEEEAKKWSSSLEDCSFCTDCRNCRDCNECTNVRACTDCYSCKDCSNCQQCAYCNGCNSCTHCRHCTYCHHCLKSNLCESCASSENIAFSKSLSECRSSEHCTNCTRSIHCFRCESLRDCGSRDANAQADKRVLFDGIEDLNGLTETPELYMRVSGYAVAWSKNDKLNVVDTLTVTGTKKTFDDLNSKALGKVKRALFPIIEAFINTLIRYKVLKS